MALSVVIASTFSSPAHADPSGATASTPRFFQPLELELPFAKPLSFSFSSEPVPGFETLRLGTYRAEAVWWRAGDLSLRTYGQVAPALELDCSSTCQPMLERVVGLDGRFDLGSAGRALPAAYVYVRGQSSQVVPTVPGTRSPIKSNLLGFGLGGLLDF